jgi:hypothetical protein
VDVIEDEHNVIVNWTPKQGQGWWNETCAMVLEVFGLPGDRFVYHPYEDYMTFTFKDKRDAFMCKVMLSDRI